MDRLAVPLYASILIAGVARFELAVAQPIPDGSELLVNTTIEGHQFAPALAVAADGTAVVVWRTQDPARPIVGRRLASGDGTPVDAAAGRALRGVGDEFEVTLVSAASLPAVASAGAEGFVVVWSTDDDVSVRRFYATGDPRGGELVVGPTVDPFGAYGASTAMSASGAFVVVWGDYGGELHARRYEPNDTRGTEIAITGVGDRPFRYYPVVAMDANEDLVVVWTGYAGIGGTGVFGRRFDRDGSPVGERFVVTDSQRAGERGPALAMRPDGSFVVAWQTNDQDGESVGVFARVFDSAADAVGPVRQLNVKASGMAIDPAVATGGSSDFSAVWTLVGPDELSEAIVGRHFDASGIAASPEFRISNASDRVSEPVAAIAADDSLLVVWQAEALAGVTTDIFARAFRAGADVDDDGVINEQDNCPTVPNPEQTDAASDGYGDDCVSPDVFLPPDARLGAAPIIGLGTVIGSGVVLGDFARIGEHVRLAPRVQAGDGLIAADLVTIGRSSVLGDNVTIDLAAALDANVTIGDAVTIHERAYVRRGAVVGARASIGRSALLGPFSRIGASATIETGVRVGRGASVAPGATVPAGVVVQPGTTFP